MDDLPRISTRTFIGILVAVSGNILISLALNLQKLAHKRVLKAKGKALQAEEQRELSFDERDEDEENTYRSPNTDDVFSDGSSTAVAELQPLVAFPEPLTRHYGSEASHNAPNPEENRLKQLFFGFKPFGFRDKVSKAKYALPVEIMTEDAALHGLQSTRRQKHVVHDYSRDVVEDSEGDYLKSRLWWLGFLLMNVGEMGNFISYAFAPASVVAPLGTFALMANCFFAPILLGEYFRLRDLLGVLIAVIGAVTVVLASNASDVRLDPDGLLRAMSQTSFIVYSCTYAAGAIVLAILSEGSIGKNWVIVDIGLCALFGGFTVLSTKALSTLLTLSWIEIFTFWITYPLLAVLIFTGVGQIRYLNRALMRFDSKVVIPIQFVLFTLSAIVGSAILYGDFQKAKFHQIVTFLYGCAATFAGVFIIAWSSKESSETHDNGTSGDADGTHVSNDLNNVAADGARLGSTHVGRRKRGTLVLPSGMTDPSDAPTLRRKRSGAVGVIAISPAQHLLLVHTPPREIPLRNSVDGDIDIERDGFSPGSEGRRRTMSWYGNDGRPDRSGRVSRDHSIVGRVRSGPNGIGRRSSLEERSSVDPGSR
ncbi:magnesium transporter NIPA-domain-containing protein [Gymnopilus junonius]|uniref:Magnesium transporter NIPA-domain-containing protein n=1 Tax=Gymnopilus junonius TaxID=109634 RepID=A0A9P5NYY7_GYMJU|nr:magnesium transporter NIPA-domain-containing protein [Gymnopilus junonius]